MYFIREKWLDRFPEFFIIRQTFDFQCLIIVKFCLSQSFNTLIALFLKSIPVLLASALIVSIAKISTGIYCLSKSFCHKGTIISTDLSLLKRRMLIQHHLNFSMKFRKFFIVSIHLSKTSLKCPSNVIYIKFTTISIYKAILGPLLIKPPFNIGTIIE